ncbi:FliG C-terminal domain-containing protein [Octadecabacter sp. 1_MG-2023]|uniref:FliG C-terminal domain-containing protein n=2 Tax=unclassified Octadecabacter TaxID=196158 RepID=UPI001C08A9B9|nr:FliG C-terminal domain-containing protein [Octadecabacter sp. 1_MG-2023]MBU2993740.1 flagellar motor switch protein FliG [Octadecabacter sp. B2R22]MDO6735415.1 FliG C-terminal domain-containing protein [Octadecabacter sp. 1_MG-2023]
MPNTATPVMPRSRKAAMVVQLLLSDGGDLPLSQLPEAAQARLTRELGGLNIIDRETLKNVAIEFAAELSDVALTAPGSVEAALKSLDGRISAATVARLREEAAAQNGSDPWTIVLELSADEMVPITTAESPEVSAILLSKLPTSKAATLLGLVPGETARRIAFSMSKTSHIRADAIARIGTGLAQQYCGAALPAFSETAESRIGAILNSSPAATREQVLEGLLSEDPSFGASVRKAIFTFADIPARLAVPDVPKILRDIDSGDLVRALASAAGTGGPLAVAANHLLDNMSTRMADNLREEMGESGKIKLSDAEAAQNAVVTAIRAAADAGTIALIVEGDDD